MTQREIQKAIFREIEGVASYIILDAEKNSMLAGTNNGSFMKHIIKN